MSYFVCVGYICVPDDDGGGGDHDRKFIDANLCKSDIPTLGDPVPHLNRSHLRDLYAIKWKEQTDKVKIIPRNNLFKQIWN